MVFITTAFRIRSYVVKDRREKDYTEMTSPSLNLISSFYILNKFSQLKRVSIERFRF